MRLVPILLLATVACAKQPNAVAIKGAWHLQSQAPAQGEPVPFDKDAEINVINWNLSGFAFKRHGTVFGLSTRDGYDFAINEGQKARYKVGNSGKTLFLKDDIFSQTFGNIRQELAIVDLTPDTLALKDESGAMYRFVRP
ncbi:MAG: hypothetical protein AB8H79_15630 [Myxococcota bacterium]